MKTLLAVSGGIDSMCMADMYSRAGEEYAVAHCNFHLRGADSDADAEFVRKWAEAHGVPFFRADFDTSAYASEKGISIEMAARELRYTWFARIAAEHGYDAVAVAHNANDNAETLILNLLRGTGLRGITGIAPESSLSAAVCPEYLCHPRQHKREGPIEDGRGPAEQDNFQGTLPPEGGQVKLIRPMLGMTREEIEKYAAEHGVEYRVDRTNAENDAKRNRIRNEVFPEFARINPSFVRTLNADMERFAQVDAIAEDYFREAEDRAVDAGGTICVAELLALKHWRYVFYRLTEGCGFSAGTFDAALRLLEDFAAGRAATFAGKRFYSPTHVLETVSGGMTVRPLGEAVSKDGSLMVEGPGVYSFRGRTVRVELLAEAPVSGLKQPAGTLLCSAAALPFPFRLRGWQSGDWMRPFGMDGRAKKLSDLFTDAKYSLSDKESAVIVESSALEDGRVAAVAGLRMDEALRVAKGSGPVLRITLL
jgi:tRNA(Ile)-lysidine synthase